MGFPMELRRSVRVIIFLLSLLLFMGAGFTGGILADRFVLSPALALASGPVQTNELGLVTEAYQIIQKVYVDQGALQPTRLVYGAISGMVDALGDTGHSRFLTPELVKQQNNFTKGSFEGIGAEVTMKDGQVVIVSPIDGSPALAAGVKPGDIFVAVDGVDVKGLDLNLVVMRVLGPAGTSVTITFQDPEKGTLRDLTITRAKINLKNVTWAMLPGTSIAHLRIAAFSHGVTEELETALKQIKTEGATGIVIDLRIIRRFIDEAVGVASQFSIVVLSCKSRTLPGRCDQFQLNLEDWH
jgi:carboxyl-terminal processing protease